MMEEKITRINQQQASTQKESQNRPTKDANEEKGSSLFFELVKVVFWALVIIVPIRTFLFQPFFVQGASMEPNFFNGEYLIVNELGYKQTSIGLNNYRMTISPYKELKRGEVVVFRYPKNPSQFFIKRVIGLPGEKVEITKEKVKIYNQEHPEGFFLDESQYLPSSTPTEPINFSYFELKDNEYVVLGDNRIQSSDSRSWGPVPENDVIGRVALRAWPMDRFSFFN